MATYDVYMKEGPRHEIKVECTDLDIMDDGTFNFWSGTEDNSITVLAIPKENVVFAVRSTKWPES